MLIHIDSRDGVPLYLQIVQQVRKLASSGQLAPGDELPPIRVLAEQLLINPNTVAKAYRELERQGLVEKRRTAGTFISSKPSPLARRERLKMLGERIDQLLAEAEQLGIDQPTLGRLLKKKTTQSKTAAKRRQSAE